MDLLPLFTVRVLRWLQSPPVMAQRTPDRTEEAPAATPEVLLQISSHPRLFPWLLVQQPLLSAGILPPSPMLSHNPQRRRRPTPRMPLLPRRPLMP